MKDKRIILLFYFAFSSQLFEFTAASRESSEESGKDDIKLEFDFIIVGAGSAGSALAGELHKQKPSWKIAVFEAGTDKITNDVIDFQKSLNLYGTEYDWQDVSEPVQGLNNRVIELTQGRGCGGSSLINGMVWFRGNKNDFNDWAAEINDDSWSYKNLLPLFKATETYSRPSIYRGTQGPIYVSPDLSDIPYNQRIRQQISTLGYPENFDYNGADQYGVSITQLNVKSNETIGIRQDAFSGYVRPHIGSRNLFIYPNCVVDRIVFKNKKIDHLIFKYKNGTLGRAKARHEIILSAGAIRTPTILMRSGVGDCNELKKHNIDCNFELKGVGKNLQDHLVSYIFCDFKVRDSNVHRTVMDINVLTGKVKPKFSNFLKPKFQLKTYYVDYGFALSVSQLHPKSRGSVTIRSKNVDDKPKVDLNYLSEKSDENDFVEGMKLVFQMAKKLQETILDKITLPTSEPTSDEEIMNFVRGNAISDYHFAGTCKMGRISDKSSVVDSKLRVHHIKGLRIADASIMPTVTSGNTNAPSMMIGLKCAKILLAEYSNL